MSFESLIRLFDSSSLLAYSDLLRYTKSYSTSNMVTRIPKVIINGSKQIKLEFLRTFWDDEGSISGDGTLSGSSNSYTVIKLLAEIHNEFRFKNSIYKVKSQDKWIYVLRLRKNKKNLRTFYKNRLFTDSIVTQGYNYLQKKFDVLERFVLFLDR